MRAPSKSSSASVLLAFALLSASASAQQLDSYELRWAESGETAKLVAVVGDREVNVATGVLHVWRGWHSSILLYSERMNDRRQRLSYFSGVTGERHVVTVVKDFTTDVTVAQLDARYQPVLVLFLRDRETGNPALALADPESGVYRRDNMATAGAILDDTLLIRYLSTDNGARDNRVAVVPLLARLPNPAGRYVSQRGAVLTLSPGGAATLRSVPGQPSRTFAGKWSEDRAHVSVVFSDETSAQWEITRAGLTPLRWDAKLLGPDGLSLVRSPATKK